jgi:hypothetical protein
MRKILTLLALLCLSVGGAYVYALYWYIPDKIKSRFAEGLQGLGFKLVAFESVSASGGSVTFNKISLDPKSFSGVEGLEIRYSAERFLLQGGQADSLRIRKMHLTGEISPSLDITLAGRTNDLSFLKSFKDIPAPAVIVEGATLELLHPEFGGLKIEFEGQIRKKAGKGGEVEILGRLKTAQKKLSFEGTVTGTVTPDGSLKAAIKTEPLQIELEGLKMSRSSGSFNFEIPAGKSLSLTSEIIAASLNWESIPLDDTKISLERKDNRLSFKAEGKTIGAEAIDFTATLKTDEQGQSVKEVSLLPQNLLLLRDFLTKNSLLSPEQVFPSLLPLDLPLPVTFSFADPAKDGVLNGQWAIENPEHTSGVRGSFLFNPQTKVLTGLCEKTSLAMPEALEPSAQESDHGLLANCSFSWDGQKTPPEAKADLAAEIKGLTLRYGPLHLYNLRGGVSEAKRTEGDPLKFLADLKFDLPLKPSIKYQGRMRVGFVPPDQGEIAAASLTVYGGSVRTDRIPLKDLELPDQVTLKISDISLRQFFTDTPLPTFKIDGRMGGVIPLIKSGKTLEIKDALLQSQDPGVIMLPDSISQMLFAGDDPQMKAMRTALKNYHYEFFEFRMDGSVSKGVLMTLNSRGMNPDLKDKRPIEINLQIETQPSFLIEHMLSTKAYQSIKN